MAEHTKQIQKKTDTKIQKKQIQKYKKADTDTQYANKEKEIKTSTCQR